jgi:hypothetical protein
VGAWVHNGNVSNLQELEEKVSPSVGATCVLRWWTLRWWLLCQWLLRPVSVFPPPPIVVRQVVFSDGRKSGMGLRGRVGARGSNNGRSGQSVRPLGEVEPFMRAACACRR